MKAKLRPGRASAWKSSSSKKKPQRGESWTMRLESLDALRNTFLDCERTIVRGVLDEYLPEAGTIVEVGAGLGQLCRWLDGTNDERWVHTEPDVEALSELRKRFPGANAEEARIEALPFAHASCSAIVGLCVFDVLSAPAAAFREFRRILAPGGKLIHFLDMAPNFEAELRELAGTGKLVLPNLFSDPSSSRWPEDLLVTDRPAMQRLLAELDRMSHPLPHVFGHYFANFERSPFDAAKAAREYEAFTRAPELRELLKTLLTSGYTTGFRLGVPAPEGELASSGRRLAERLESAASSAGFTVELNDMRAAWAHGPRAGEGPSYRSIALGNERRGHDLPDALLCPDAAPASDSEVLLEAAMSVFVARV